MKRELFWQVRKGREALILTVVFGVLGAAVMIVQMTILSKVVSNVFLGHERLEQVESLLLLLLGVILARAAIAWAREFTAQQAAIHVKAELRERLYTHLLRLGPSFSKGERSGELVATASEGIERLDAYVSRYVPQMALSVLVPLLIIVAVLPVDWLSAILLLITGPIIPVLMILIGSFAEKHVQRQWLTLARMSAQFLDAIQGLPTLKLFGRSSAVQGRVARLSDEFRERTLKMLRVAFLSGMVLEFMVAGAIGLVAVTLGVRLLNGAMPFENAFLVLLLAPEFFRPLRDLGIQRHAGMEGKAAEKRIREILETPVPAQTKAKPARRPLTPLTISLTGVTYTYPGSGRATLKGVNITLLPGTCTALVGRSGAGKSTLVHLLLRFMDVQEGQIAVNDVPLNELPVDVWREYVALVPQQPYLFYDSVLANIRMARPGASEAEVREAAELAGAASFIEELPRGYATELGERGTRLSAGQAQRIAIARAFLKDAPLLILDEPTASLDPESEAHIRRALERLVGGRTVLVIAHRYNTIAGADRVAVLEDGKLVEVGDPTALLQRNGTYAHFVGTNRKV